MELGKLILDGREIGEERPLSDFEDAILNSVFKEITRIYWNYYQEELSAYLTEEDKDNIFGKHGVTWKYYDWSEEPSNDPNLVINNTNIWVYKYYGRSMTTDRQEPLDEKWFTECQDILSKIEKENDKY
jgi:hypothetical protein